MQLKKGIFVQCIIENNSVHFNYFLQQPFEPFCKNNHVPLQLVTKLLFILFFISVLKSHIIRLMLQVLNQRVKSQL